MDIKMHVEITASTYGAVNLKVKVVFY